MYSEFTSSYQTLAQASSKKNHLDTAFVYADSQGVLLLTDMVSDIDTQEDGVFAVSIGHDGWIQLVSTGE